MASHKSAIAYQDGNSSDVIKLQTESKAMGPGPTLGQSLHWKGMWMKQLINATTILSLALYIVPPFAAQAQDLQKVMVGDQAVFCLPNKAAVCPDGQMCVLAKKAENCQANAEKEVAKKAAEAAGTAPAKDQAATDQAAADKAAADKAAADKAAADKAAADKAAADKAAADKAAAEKAAADKAAADKAALSAAA